MAVDISSALDLKLNHNLSYKQIGQIQGVSAQAIHQRIKDLLPTDSTELYKKHRSDIIANTQLKVIEAFNSLDEDETKDLVKRRGMVDFGILYDKERIERGLSTANIDIHAEIAALKGVTAKQVVPEDGK